jgi:hypothetical protein
MAAARKVTHYLRLNTGSGYAGGQMTFTLDPGIYTGDGNSVTTVSSVNGVAAGSGLVEAMLVPGNYTVEFPDGVRWRMTVPAGSGDLLLTDLLSELLPSMEDDRWAGYKAALREYSAYRPLLVKEAWVPVVAATEQTLPANVIGVEYILYGERASLTEIYSAAEGEQGWCLANGKLYLAPAPADATPITVIWRKRHVPDEVTRSCLTLPEADKYLLEQFADALGLMTQQDAVDAGLSSYTIGNTTVKWAQQGGGVTNVLSRGRSLYQQVISALAEPYTEWG